MTTAQVLKDVTSVVATDKDTTTTERATAQYSVADTGVVTVRVTPNGAVDKGDGFTITVLGTTITCMAKNDGLASELLSQAALGCSIYLSLFFHLSSIMIVFRVPTKKSVKLEHMH